MVSIHSRVPRSPLLIYMCLLITIDFLQIIALPQHEPSIEGIKNSYEIGDFLIANCTSAKSDPPSKIIWYINDKKVSIFNFLIDNKIFNCVHLQYNTSDTTIHKTDCICIYLCPYTICPYMGLPLLWSPLFLKCNFLFIFSKLYFTLPSSTILICFVYNYHFNSQLMFV